MDEEYLDDVYNNLGGEETFGEYIDFATSIKSDPTYMREVYDNFGEETLGSFDDFSRLMKESRVKNISKPKEKEVKDDTLVEQVDKEVEETSPPSKDIVEGVDEETSLAISNYKNKLRTVMNSDLPLKKQEELRAISNEGNFINVDNFDEYYGLAGKSIREENKKLDDSEKIKGHSDEHYDRAREFYYKDLVQKEKEKEYNEILENFETELGVNRTEDLGSFIETVTQFTPIGTIKKGISGIRSAWDMGSKYMAGEDILTKEEQEQYDKDFWGFLVNQKDRYSGTEQQKDYERNRQELYRQLRTDEHELEKEYRDKVSDLTAVGDSIQVSIKRLGDFEKRIQAKDPNFTKKDYEEYTALFDEVKIAKEEFDKDVENLGTIPSNDFETIKNLTLKTYDNLDMVNNNISSSLVGVVGGLTALQKELNLPLAILKWSGYDLTKEDDLNKVFGEGDSILKSGARTVGEINEKGDEMIDGVFNLSQAIKGQNAPTIQSIGDIKSPEDFGMYMADMLSGQVVNTGMTIAFPPVGLALMAGSAAGTKMHDMNIEMRGVKDSDGNYIVEPKKISPLQYYTTAALYGGAEYVTEKVSLGILKGGLSNVRKALRLSGDTGTDLLLKSGTRNLTLKNLTNAQSWGKFGFDYTKDSFKEAGAEGVVQLTNNFADRYVLQNKDVSILDGMTDAMAAGFLMGNVFQTPALTAQVISSFSSEGEFGQANKLNKQLSQLSEQRNEILNRGGDAGPIQMQIDNLLDKQMESMNKVRQRTLDMTPADRQSMVDLYNSEHKLRTEIDKINANSEYSKETKAIMINDLSQKLADSESQRERVIANATFNKDIKRSRDLANQIRIENGTLGDVQTVVAEDADSALQQGLDSIDAREDLSDQQKSALKKNLETEFNDMKKKSSDGETYHGFAWGDNIEIETQKDGKMVKETVNVPMTFALNKDNMTVQSHELGHQTLFKQFLGGNPDAVGLVEDLEGYVKKNYKQAYERFEKVRGAYQTEGLTKEQMAEEQLAHLSDFMRTNNLKGDRTLYNKLFGRFQKVNDGSNEISTGKDVFDMLNSYNQSFETGNLQGLAKSVIKGEAVIKRQAQQARDARAQEQISDIQANLKQKGVKPSKFIEGETTQERSKRQTKRNVDVDKVYQQDAVGKDNEAWRDFLDSPKGQKVMGDLVNQYYPDMVATAIKRKAESPTDAASEALIPLMQHIQAFDPSKNKNLPGYIGGYLGLKVGTGVKKAAKKAPTISMEKEGVKEVAEKQAVKEETREESPVRKGIKLAERLGDAAKKISEKVKKMKPVLEGKTYKTLKDLAPDDTQRMFGIKPKPGNLTREDVKNAQAFINKNADILLAMLPEGTTVSGKATGVQKVLLDAFYTKGRRVKAAKTGSKAGLATQTKRPDIKISEFKELFGITPAGQPNVVDRNTSARIKALVDQTGKLITNQAIREVTPTAPKEIAEGKSKVMFAKDISKPKTKGVKENIKYIQEKAGIKPLEVRGEGRVQSIDYLMNDFFPKLINEFGDAASLLLKSSTISPAGNEAISFNKDGSLKKTGGAIGRDQLFINSIIKTIKSKPQTQKLLDEGKLGQLQDVLSLLKNADIKANTNTDAIKTATLPQKTPNLDRNIKSRKQHIKGSEAIINSLKKLYDNDSNALAGIAFMLYNANANSAFYRNLAQLIGIEDGSGKNNAREEHIFQAGPWAQRTLEAITKDKKIFDAYNKWQAENYYQETITKDSERLVDGKYKLEDGTFWDAKSQEHPYMKDQLDKAMSNGDFSKVSSPDIRKYNEFFHLNPNSIIRENVSDAKRYNVEVSNNLKNNKDVIALQADLIFKQIKGEIDAKTAKQMLKIGLPIAIQQSKQATPANETIINKSGVMKSKDLSNSETIRQAEVMDKALNIAKDPNAPVKKIRVFDFDDTLARTKSNVLYTMPDGKTGKLNAEQFAERGTELMEQGVEFDFSEFNKVIDGKKGPLFKVAEMIADKRGTQDMFVLTARSAAAAPAIKEFLDSLGLNIPLQNITGLADSSPLAKSGWMVDKAAEGYNDFYFADDATQNVAAVKRVLDVVDVKSKVQQAKIRFSKDVDTIFNDIIENKTGILSAKEYSPAKAQTVGASKGKWKFWIAPSAEDFVGLLYPLLGKGALGDTQMAWFKKHLLDPYGAAMENISRTQNRLSNDFKALKKALVKSGSIPKNLNKKAIGKWTHQDVARITAWHTQGFDIPGLSKADLNEILDFVRENPGIKEFADQLIMINKGDGYIKPGKDWLAGTISTDLLDGLRTNTRSEYLQEWKANKDLIFSEKNLNKLEAAFGPKYREAMEDMLRRMETGKNRTSTGSRLENRLLDYINNSVGAVMFLNMRSGVLQTISAINFLNWKDNNPLKAGIAFANQPQYWKDFMSLMNSDFLVDRRNGLKINVSESEIADAARTSKNKAKAVISYLLKKGFTVTQIMDSFAIASGGATFYRNRINKYIKEGMSQKDAETKAFQDFREVAEESQQSSRPDRVSQQQASALGRIILAFANTPMQYNRIMKKAFLDLKNGRGDAKAHLSKIIYYGAIQNFIFTAMQQAMFALLFDDEEETDEAKKKKYYRMANSMMDNILRGLGIWGTAASTLVAIIRKAIEESQKKGYPGADYDAAAMELLNFSPPIDIKMSKLRQAGSNWKYEGWKHDDAKWGINDPAYKSAAYVIASLANVPVDRLYKKMDNIQSALDSDNETWKRIANALGWANWELESTKEREERRKKEKSRKKEIKQEKIQKEEENKIATMSKADKEKLAKEKEYEKYKDLNKAEQVSKLDSLGLSKSEIRGLKYEEDRVEKLIELMNK